MNRLRNQRNYEEYIMHNIIYSSKSVDLVEDTTEDTVYLSITDYRDNTHYTEDFSKEELVVILKDMLEVLGE